MDSLDLIAREDEFKKLNKQLERKTQSLLKEIEQAMQKQDIFSEFSPTLTLTPVHTRKKHNCNTLQPITPPHTQQTDYRRKSNKTSTEIKHNAVFQNGSSGSEISVKFENGTACKNTDGSKFENKLEDTTNFRDEKYREQNSSTILCNCCVNANHSEDREFLYAFVSINVKEKVLPQGFLRNRPTVESVCKFLSSKVKLMQEQLDGLQSTLNKKASQCNSHLTQLAELESERMTLLNRCNSMKSSTADMRAKYMAIQNRCDEKEKLYIEQRSLADKLSCEVKQLRSKTTSLEAKCATHQNTVELLTQQLDAVKKTEKELQNNTRTVYASHQKVITQLELQLKSQATRIDKQMALMDNLRRQNMLLSTDAAVKALEKDYCEYLQKDF